VPLPFLLSSLAMSYAPYASARRYVTPIFRPCSLNPDPYTQNTRPVTLNPKP
jgi:hypothetical protein